MKSISCLLLAAGESKRMGADNKLLLKVQGQSLIKRTLSELVKFPFEEIIVVTGFEAKKIMDEVKLPKVEIVHNENYQTGMHSSIRAGLKNVRPQSEGFIVCLADQPQFQSGIIWQMEKQITSKPQIVFPTSDGVKGNPVYISKHFVPEILSHPDGDYGCSYLFKRHAEYLTPVEVADQGVLIDIDTPNEYENFKGL